MSNSHADLADRLKEVQQQHRRRHISEELDEVAETMEETILQNSLAKGFFGEQSEIDPEAKEEVQTVLSLLEENQYDEVEEQLSSLRSDVEAAETTVENRIQELRLKHSTTVGAMRRLNERVERVDSEILKALQGLLDDWRWRQHVYQDEEDADLEQLKANAEQYGTEMRQALELMQGQLFDRYPQEIKGLIERMIDDERLSFTDLTENQREQLAESDIGEYIELTLS